MHTWRRAYLPCLSGMLLPRLCCGVRQSEASGLFLFRACCDCGACASSATPQAHTISNARHLPIGVSRTLVCVAAAKALKRHEQLVRPSGYP